MSQRRESSLVLHVLLGHEGLYISTSKVGLSITSLEITNIQNFLGLSRARYIQLYSQQA